jgi:hypothetical protein
MRCQEKSRFQSKLSVTKKSRVLTYNLTLLKANLRVVAQRYAASVQVFNLVRNRKNDQGEETRDRWEPEDDRRRTLFFVILPLVLLL